MYATDRKTSYKLPPTTIRDRLVSQEARRSKALEEQKRRRAQKIDSSRHLDLFADLSLAEASDEEINEHDVDDGTSTQSGPAPTSVAAYVSLLQTTDLKEMKVTALESTSSSTPSHYQEASTFPLTSHPPSSSTGQHTIDNQLDDPSANAPTDAKKSRKRGGKNSHKRRSEANKVSNSNKYKGGSSKWADKCMYAELLELNGDEVWNGGDGMGYDDQDIHDGLPRDLESGWVAVAPVPKGKRCLVVTQQSAGVAGVVPNTTLRSRLLGKFLLSRFPSTLPPLTVLDCILDENWRENGILHVLDVVRWKGQDVADCEAGFRFWWRDTRLAELPQTPPPSFHFVSSPPAPASTNNALVSNNNSSSAQIPQANRYYFPYPTTFIPVPYHSNTTLSVLDTHIIPAARSIREVRITLPASIPGAGTATASMSTAEGEMEVEEPMPPQLLTESDTALMPTTALVHPDGLLLYIAEASYEPGTSPLSSWIPIRGYSDDVNSGEAVAPEGPLDLFQRLVKRRLDSKVLLKSEATSDGISGDAGGSENPSAGDVEMEFYSI